MSRGREPAVRRRFPRPRPGVVGAGRLPVDRLAGGPPVDAARAVADDAVVMAAGRGPRVGMEVSEIF